HQWRFRCVLGLPRKTGVSTQSPGQILRDAQGSATTANRLWSKILNRTGLERRLSNQGLRRRCKRATPFGLWDSFGVYEMSRSTMAADIYEQHIREVQLAELLGYSSYFIIEHQNSHVGQITAPSVYLCAVAQHTSRIRLGTMIYQLPLHNPLRLAQDAAMLDHLSRGRLEFGAGLGTHEHEFMRWNTSFAERRAMGDEALELILKAWTEETVT